LNLTQLLAEARRALREFLFGATTFEFYRELKLMSRRYNDAIYLIMLGEMLGIPFLSNYYSLRLLPYILVDLNRFKREAMRERELLEELGEIHVH
jgi:hypothetical protein